MRERKVRTWRLTLKLRVFFFCIFKLQNQLNHSSSYFPFAWEDVNKISVACLQNSCFYCKSQMWQRKWHIKMVMWTGNILTHFSTTAFCSGQTFNNAHTVLFYKKYITLVKISLLLASISKGAHSSHSSPQFQTQRWYFMLSLNHFFSRGINLKRLAYSTSLHLYALTELIYSLAM